MSLVIGGKSKMRQHGFLEIAVEKNLLVSQLFDAWNYEQTCNYKQQVKEASKPLLSRPWARVVDLSYWEGGGEEVVKPLHDLHLWSLENNCCAIVFVNPPLLPQFMLEKYGDPYKVYQICKTLDQAKTWAKKELLKESL